LRFRSGRTVPAPRGFLARLPAQPLDGELWLARGQFDALSAIVRKAEPIDDEWRGVHYMVFELPAASGTFAQRYAEIQGIVRASSWPALRAVEQVHVADAQALKRMLADVHGAGGEGLMLHRADAPVATGRSDVLLKLKPLADTEAQVVAHIAGQGKYAGMMGALEVRTPAGRRFRIGTGFSDAQRRDPPPLGSTITYTYRDLTASGLPRFASYLRMADSL
ncbi:MAG TPA: DNA ligase, partial [Albitalea sp.]|nr:DNA ligase [Albitalea sp.]